MLEVQVKGPAIKIQGIWKFKGEKALATQDEYLENKEYLELIKGEAAEEENKKTGVQNLQDNSKDNNDDTELQKLREKAKDLGIKGAHNMKKENLIAKIEEVEKADNGEDGEGKENKEDGEDGQPQE